jgi:hypothetical protein
MITDGKFGIKVLCLQYHHVNQLESYKIYFQLEILKVDC